MGYTIGVDVGGTFTDVVLGGTSGAIAVAKCLSTHYDPIAGIVAGVTRALGDRDPAQVRRVVHATTLATNAVLERKGVRVAFVTTQGFRAAVPLGRYARVEEDRYDLRFSPPPPPVAAGDCFEVVERVSARGAVLTPLDLDSVRRAAAAITARGITSAAVCLLHSYADPAHERQVAEILRESIPDVVTSSEIWPEIREYERATTTIMSAYIGPLMASYLSQLRERLAEIGIRAPVHVMESSGGVISAELAARRAVATIESGPAAGVLAAAGTGFPNVISFDMGGTTAKACVVRGGAPEITNEFHVGGKGSFGGRRAGTGVPIKTPAIDLAEVGAGGGSVAWLDAAGALRVGPHSAGSSPGPACYGLGGSEPTVTDANLVLGYLSSASLPLTPDLAAKALDRLASPLGVSREEAAYAVHEIVSASMASAVHVVTVQRGIDPRGFALVAFGGAGPMHAARVAERFGIGTVVVPAHCGVASAAGLLTGALSTDRVLSRLDAPDPSAVFTSLTAEAAADLGVSPSDPGVLVSRSVDVRFKGQSHDLTVEWTPSREVLASRFFTRYEEVYGIAQRGDIELVSYRIRLTAPTPPPPDATAPPAAHTADTTAPPAAHTADTTAPPAAPPADAAAPPPDARPAAPVADDAPAVRALAPTSSPQANTPSLSPHPFGADAASVGTAEPGATGTAPSAATPSGAAGGATAGSKATESEPLRDEAAATDPGTPGSEVPGDEGAAAVPRARRAYFPETGGYVDVPVHTRDTMAGGPLHGPAIIEDAESTIVVPPGWSATLAGTRAVHLTRSTTCPTS